jgi:uncharacterized paraquat-inducible protein A
MDQRRKIVLLPCKHLVLCKKCTDYMQADAVISGNSARCPYCREEVQDTMAVFR